MSDSQPIPSRPHGKFNFSPECRVEGKTFEQARIDRADVDLLRDPSSAAIVSASMTFRFTCPGCMEQRKDTYIYNMSNKGVMAARLAALMRAGNIPIILTQGVAEPGLIEPEEAQESAIFRYKRPPQYPYLDN